jgi:hypothetical protein
VIEIPEKRADAHKWLLQFKEIKENWLDEVVAERTGSERTIEAYLDRIIPFIQYMKMTLAQIIRQKFIEKGKNSPTS